LSENIDGNAVTVSGWRVALHSAAGNSALTGSAH